jgi:dipeptidyl aminopeptidase/acylaminoacyl peptidase
LKDAARVKTPTLFFVGQDDTRVPMPQSVEMYRALVTNGVPTRLYVAPREGHQWGELRHQLYKANAELEWFERYVMDRKYNWERAPGDGAATVPPVSATAPARN